MIVVTFLSVVLVLSLNSTGSEALAVDYWALSPSEQEAIRAQNPEAFEPTIQIPGDMVLHVVTEVQDQSLPAPVVHDAYAYFDGEQASRLLVSTSDSTGRLQGTQLTVDGRTQLPDGTIVETGNATLGELLPSLDPEFIRENLNLTELEQTGPGIQAFEVRALAPHDRYIRQLTVSTDSHVVLDFRLFEETNDGGRVVLDRRSVRFEWVPLSAAPVALLEGAVE